MIQRRNQAQYHRFPDPSQFLGFCALSVMVSECQKRHTFLRKSDLAHVQLLDCLLPDLGPKGLKARPLDGLQIDNVSVSGSWMRSLPRTPCRHLSNPPYALVRRSILFVSSAIPRFPRLDARPGSRDSDAHRRSNYTSNRQMPTGLWSRCLVCISSGLLVTAFQKVSVPSFIFRLRSFGSTRIH